MVSRKAVAFAFGIMVLGAALLHSLGGAQPESEKLIVYSGFAYYEQAAKVTGPEVSFALPYGVETDSVSLRLVSGYVTSQHVKEANYTTESDILESYVGEEVLLYDENGKEIKGTLLKYDYGRAYVKAAEGLYVITPSYYLLPGFSGEMKEENASIVFKITSSTQTDGKLSYLMDSISWQPVYALYLNGNGGTLSLYGDVDNYAQDYENVSLSLFYGQVQKASRGYYYDNYDYAKGANYYSMESAPSAAGYTPTQISEFYKFDLGNVALPTGETKYNLMEKTANRVKKTYEMSVNSYNSDYSALAIMLAINNSQANGLGSGGLPSGTIRVMNADGFVGESYVSETPKDEEMEFSIGNAFDVIGMSRLVNQTSDELVDCDPRVMAPEYAPICVGERGYIYVDVYEYEATVKNKKSEGADVVLTYSPYGEWVILDESMPSEKLSQNEVKWRFSMGSGSEKTLKFTIKVKSRSGYYPYGIPA